MQKAENLVRMSPPEPNPEICIRALKEGIAEAEQRRAESDDGRRYCTLVWWLVNNRRNKPILLPVYEFLYYN